MTPFLLILSGVGLGLFHGWGTKWIWSKLLSSGSESGFSGAILAVLLVLKLGLLAALLIGMIRGDFIQAQGLPVELRIATGVGGFLVGLAGFIYFEVTVGSN